MQKLFGKENLQITFRSGIIEGLIRIGGMETFWEGNRNLRRIRIMLVTDPVRKLDLV